jgi:hypothetical protein
MGWLEIDKSFVKKPFLIPAPLLVGIELNPGPLTPDERKEIVTLKKAGFSFNEIVARTKKNIKTVRRWAKRADVKPSRQPSFKINLARTKTETHQEAKARDQEESQRQRRRRSADCSRDEESRSWRYFSEHSQESSERRRAKIFG